MAVFAPMPSASVSTAIDVNPGVRASVRIAYRKSCMRLIVEQVSRSVLLLIVFLPGRENRPYSTTDFERGFGPPGAATRFLNDAPRMNRSPGLFLPPPGNEGQVGNLRLIGNRLWLARAPSQTSRRRHGGQVSALICAGPALDSAACHAGY